MIYTETILLRERRTDHAHLLANRVGSEIYLHTNCQHLAYRIYLRLRDHLYSKASPRNRLETFPGSQTVGSQYTIETAES